MLELYREGFEVPVPPSVFKGTVFFTFAFCSLINDSSSDSLFDILYAPTSWSQDVNGYIYETAALVLKAAQAHNVTIPGGKKYNVPSGNITIDNDAAPNPNLTSYSTVAISGADDFRDNNTEIKVLFDTIVEITRDITPTCQFPTTHSYLFVFVDTVPNQVGAAQSGTYVQEEANSEDAF